MNPRLKKVTTTALALLGLGVGPIAHAQPTVPDVAPSTTAAARAERSTWANAPTQTLSAGGVEFAYRELGQHHGGPPLVLLTHLAAVLDNWDPRVVDGLAAQRHVIAFDNRGVGASSGSPAKTIEQMADDAIMFLRAQGHAQVDLFGFSMGGMIAQEMALKETEPVQSLFGDCIGVQSG